MVNLQAQSMETTRLAVWPTVSALPKYLPELDGLRAVAVIVVLFFHLHVPGFQLGWAGVFLFFVLSGFLITGNLLDARHEPHFFRNFYIRRTLRIFPIYYLVFFAIIAYGLITDAKIGDAAWYGVYLQNMLLGHGSFSADFPRVFNHSWSLAVEEQFYLIWPLAVFYLSRRRLAVLSMGMIFFAIFFRFAASYGTGNASYVFMLLPCIMDSLAVGAMLAISLRWSGAQVTVLARGARWVTLFSGLCLAGLVGSWGYQKYAIPADYLLGSPINLFLHTFMAVFFGALIAWVVLDRQSLLSRMLRNGAMRHIGKISYGIYLYHFPVFYIVRHVFKTWGAPNGGRISWDTSRLGVETIACALAQLAITYLVALASWHVIEKRILALKEKLAPAARAADGSVEEIRPALSGFPSTPPIGAAGAVPAA